MTTIAGPWGNLSSPADDTPDNRAVDALQHVEPSSPVVLDEVDSVTREMAAYELAIVICGQGRYLTLNERMVFAAALLPEFHQGAATVGDLP